MGDDDERVRGMGVDQKRAEEGLKLFKTEEEAEYDTEAATKHKDATEAQIAKLDAEAELLTGKENKKARTEKDKEKKALKDAKEYIDALKILKGLKPPNGSFVKKAAGPSKEQVAADEKKAAEEKAAADAKAEADAKSKDDGKAGKPKKVESAGISKAERDELEKMKNDIIAKKKTMKEQGMSGGQMNKDEEIVKWVARMNELKEKENPGGLAAAKDEKKGGSKKKKTLDSAQSAALEEKERAMEEYLEKLRTEFKYSKKEILADPDLIDMKVEIEKLKK